MITPPSIRVKDASGVSRSIVETLTRERRGHLGIVGDDHELYFEVEPTAEIEDDTVPIQVQVEYTGEDGARHVRAVTTTLPVARREDEILASLDATLGATFITQKAGEDAFRGEREHGRSRLSAFRSALRKRAGHAPAPARARLMEVDAVLESEEENSEDEDSEGEDDETPPDDIEVVETKSGKKVRIDYADRDKVKRAHLLAAQGRVWRSDQRIPVGPLQHEMGWAHMGFLQPLPL